MLRSLFSPVFRASAPVCWWPPLWPEVSNDLGRGEPKSQRTPGIRPSALHTNTLAHNTHISTNVDLQTQTCAKRRTHVHKQTPCHKIHTIHTIRTCAHTLTRKHTNVHIQTHTNTLAHNLHICTIKHWPIYTHCMKIGHFICLHKHTNTQTP